MSAGGAVRSAGPITLREELRKLSAFLRRDVLVAWSYRASFVSDWVGLLVQAVLFSFAGRLVDSSKLPVYGDMRVSYIQFVAIGIALGVFVQIALTQITTGIRQEQVQGTLESLLMTPTAPTTIQLGAVMYQIVYTPIRTAAFLLLIGVIANVHFAASGALPATALMLAFIPFIWGLGVMSSAAIITFRRGAGAFSLGTGLLTLASGAYFPLELLPHWLARAASYNPMAVAMQGMRLALIGGTGWSEVAHRVAVLLPCSAVALGLGTLSFRRAVARERRRGTLGLY